MNIQTIKDTSEFGKALAEFGVEQTTTVNLDAPSYDFLERHNEIRRRLDLNWRADNGYPRDKDDILQELEKIRAAVKDGSSLKEGSPFVLTTHRFGWHGDHDSELPNEHSFNEFNFQLLESAIADLRGE